jgi:hypothetical protein
LALLGPTVYAGGTFETIGGLTVRNGLAAVDAIAGRAAPVGVLDLEGTFALAASDSALYVGGDDGVAVTRITAKVPANEL